MSLPVHLVPSLAGVTVGSVVELTGDEAHHAVVVRRLREGERVVLVDGEGTAVLGTVRATSKAALEVDVEEVSHEDRSTPFVTVVQAIPKGDRGELAVEVLTEVGVDRIVPWSAERAVGVWRGERATKALAKWRSTAREAGKQSRRAWLPEVTGQMSTAEVAALLREADLAVVLHEAASEPLAALTLDGMESLVVVVGPEGGISDGELLAFADAHVVRMGETVLRTSTAGLAAVAALLSRTSRWG
jgi:16S rRNA (uracil1498-N3)-methyltransferase